MNKKQFYAKLIAYAALAAVLLCGLAIFLFSSQNGDASASTSGGVIRFLLTIMDPSFRKLDEAGKALRIAKAQYPIRKAAHFTAYAVLGFLLIFCQQQMLLAYRQQTGLMPGAALTLVACFLYAMSDEWHQSFTVGRSASMTDVLIDTSGALAGILIFILCLYLYRRIRQRRKTKSET